MKTIIKITAHLNNDQGCNFDNTTVTNEKEAISWAIGRKGTLTTQTFFSDGSCDKESFKKIGKRYESQGIETSY